ncbi:hypothetical protein ABMA28_015670 [Loxostege sticticalis]|uniref:Integrase catalytic domain-containing protein n=1 Tax=Loxostege sticticalis TaxID=481309 RepID=A0ABD0TAJ8_LOXSC
MADDESIEPTDIDNEIQQLSRSRASYKGKLTQFINFLNNISTPPTVDDVLNLELRINNIECTYDKFDSIQSRLDTLSDDTESQILERSKFEEPYFNALAKAKGLVKTVKVEITKPESAAYSSEVNDCIKFPEISLPNFSGDFKEWLEFRETFDALINQSSLKPIQKFKYLRSCLKDGALEVVNSLEYSGESYQMAWKLLCERYNNPRLLVSNHLRSLLDTEKIQNESAQSLRTLIDNMNKHLRSLRMLNIPTNDWDLLIIHFMCNKLPPPLRRSWEEQQCSNELPSLQEFKGFLRRRADILDNARLDTTKSGGLDAPRKTMVTTSLKSNSGLACPQCKGRHYLNQFVKSFKLCTNCLGNNHTVTNCRSSHCKYCKGKHHTILHIDSATPTTLHSEPFTTSTSLHSHQPNNQTATSMHTNAASTNHTHTNAVTAAQDKLVFLSTAIVRAFDSRQRPHYLRVLLDSGSQSNFISKRACQLLNLPKNNVAMEVIGFNNNSTEIKHYCNLNIESNDTKYQTKLSCLIVPQICNLPNFSSVMTNSSLNIPAHIKLADENFSSMGEVDLLIGAELFYNLLCVGQHRLGDGYPILQKTKLGWIVSGSLSGPMQVRCNLSLHSQLKHFWEMEECSQNPFDVDRDQELSHDDKQCEEVFMKHTRSSEGNFVVNLPLKQPVSALGESKHIAKQRFRSLERKFSNNNELKQMYVKSMREFEQAGRMEKCTSSDVPLNYLPHHAVVNLEKSTTPLRVVFDASCQTASGLSLNDILHKGTINQDKLSHILLRFRLHKYVINADICKMFCCILINAEQQPLQCILWREEPHHELQTYKLTTLSFGLKPAPHIATRCLLHLAHETRTALQQLSDTVSASQRSTTVTAAAAAAIEEQFYADDLLLSGDDEDLITQVALEVDRILSSAKFHLRKWKTNSPHIQQSLPSQTPTQENVPLGRSENDIHKILGLEWSNHTDMLHYSINLQPIPKHVTKRVILSRVSSIFDPLGLLSPCLILAKCFIQRLWVDGSDWDQPISESLLNDWFTFYNKLQYLKQIQIPRVVTISKYVTFKLHGFADSSTQAYGAAIYVLTTDALGQTLSRLLFAKTRVAPLKTQTIPRLELSAALLLATNMKDVQSALKVPIDDIQYWSDSTITLAWINTEPHKLNTFVANRVTKIQALSDTSKWSWVPSNENPADLLSRGVLADKLVNCPTISKLWFEGPAFLSRPQNEWPQNKHQGQLETPELRTKQDSHKTFCNTTQTRGSDNKFINELISKWSSDSKLFHVFSYILRFLHNCKNKNNKITGAISCEEQKQATYKLIKLTQRESFPNEYKLLQNNMELPKASGIQKLKPFLENGLIRVGGRLSQSQYEYDKKHPIILHSNHTLTKLIMRNEHVRLMHAGPQLLLSSVKERFWPIKGKQLANRIIRECVPCFRAKPETPTPIMGDLPSSRVHPAPPFYTVGLDYAGPFLLKDRQGRGYKTYKAYIAIFICFSTKAVHIELVTGLDTQSFLAAFRRFIARRGKPQVVMSDNGTNFRGADREIRELYEFLTTSSEELTASGTDQGIVWKFVPSYSPHMNGLAESAVKSCKFHLKRVLKQSLLTYEGFATILTQIEGILNSRPLCPIPFSDSELFQILTPAHFLIGRTPTALPDYQYDEVPTNRLTYFKQLQQIYQSFWRGFSRDYVGLLQQRGKWRSSKGPCLATGTVVLIKESHTPPCQWRLGKIIETHPGADGVARVATIKTSQGTIVKLSFAKICPLPTPEEN